jgi:hypothetical protein
MIKMSRTAARATRKPAPQTGASSRLLKRMATPVAPARRVSVANAKVTSRALDAVIGMLSARKGGLINDYPVLYIMSIVMICRKAVNVISSNYSFLDTI